MTRCDLHAGKMNALAYEMRTETVLQKMWISATFGQAYLSGILLKETEDLRP
jgi:hypothetical protein